MEDIREVNWEMIKRFLNKKIEQKNKNDFRPILYIVITLVATMITCIILMSFKASAVDLGQSVNFVGSWNVGTYFWTGQTCNVNNSAQPAYAYNQRSDGNYPCNTGLTISGLNGLGWNRNYIFAIPLYFYEIRDREPLNAYINSTPELEWYRNGSRIGSAEFVGNSVSNISESATIVWTYFRFNSQYNETFNSQDDLRFRGSWGLMMNEYVQAPANIALWSFVFTGGEVDFSQLISAINNQNTILNNMNANMYEINQKITQNQSTVNNIDNTLQDSIDNTQQASDEGNANAQQSQSDNEQASQNIIGLIGNIVNIFYTPAGNCIIPVDLGRGFDMGNINLCSGKPAEFAQIINLAGSIIIVYACYRVARTIFRLWIAMNVFGQGGKDNG